jgi:hypothetical protein
MVRTQDHLPPFGTVEELLEVVADVSSDTSSLGLWVPGKLTLKGKAVSRETAMAAIRCALIVRGFQQDDYAQGHGGRFYIFVR